MVLPYFKPPNNQLFAAVIMNHGRNAEQRATPARYRYRDVARHWLRSGVAVFVPSRLGYGDRGMAQGPEYTGTCSAKNFDAAAVDTNLQALAALPVATWAAPIIPACTCAAFCLSPCAAPAQ